MQLEVDVVVVIKKLLSVSEKLSRVVSDRLGKDCKLYQLKCQVNPWHFGPIYIPAVFPWLWSPA